MHSWGVDFYVFSIETCSFILIILYIFIFVKVWKGTRYPFILFLIVLFLLSNLCMMLMAYFRHEGTVIASTDKALIDYEYFETNEDLRTSFELGYEICFNVAIWCFSFRYWNISFVMPSHMSGSEVTKCYKYTSISLFFLGLIVNILAPVIYASYAFIIN